MNIRRALPLSSLVVFNSSALTSSVSSILVPPQTLFLTQSTILGQFSFRKSLSGNIGSIFLTILSATAFPFLIGYVRIACCEHLQFASKLLRHSFSGEKREKNSCFDAHGSGWCC